MNCIKEDVKHVSNQSLLKYEKDTKLLLTEFHENIDWEEFSKIN